MKSMKFLILSLLVLAAAAKKHGKHDELTRCQQLAQPVSELVGVFRPSCDEQGEFLPRQCHGSTGYCWCVDSHGELIDGTLRGPTEEPPFCIAHQTHALTTCEIAHEQAKQANAEAEAQARTAHEEATDSGAEDKKNHHHHAEPAPEPETPAPETDSESDSESEEELDIEYVFVPKCNKHGEYRARQCDGNKKKERACWCVGSDGVEIDGTRTEPGQKKPHCKKIIRELERAAAEGQAVADAAEEVVDTPAVPPVETVAATPAHKPKDLNAAPRLSGVLSSGPLLALAVCGVLCVVLFLSQRKHSRSSLASQDATVVTV